MSIIQDDAVASTSGKQPTKPPIKNYAERLEQRLVALYTSQKFSDVTLKADGQEFPCHRVILSAASEYFEAMFSSGMRESSSNVIEMKSLDATTLALLLSYVYSGKVELTTENVQNLAAAADEFQFELLGADCERFMMKKVGITNCTGFYLFAKLYRQAQLLKKSKSLMLKNFKYVIRTPEFSEFSHEDLIDYISDAHLFVLTEDTVFEAACMWARADLEKRKEVFPQVAARIRFPYCSEAYLCVEVAPCSLMSHPDCQKYLHEARKYHMVPEQRHQMSTPRTQPRKSFPSKTCLVAFGGSLGNALRNKDLYYLRSNDTSWQKNPNISFPKMSFFTASAVGNTVLVTGGMNKLRQLEVSTYAYDTGLCLWRQLPNLVNARINHGQTVYNKAVYLIGGSTSVEQLIPSKTIEMYSNDLKQWILETDMPKALALPLTISYGKFIYVFAGVDEAEKWTTSTWAYNPVWKTWTQFADMPEVVSMGNAVVVNDKTYIVGGCTRSCLSYDMALDTWAVLKRPRVQRMYGGAAFWKGKIILVGGKHNDNNTNKVEEYDIAKDKWKYSAIDFPNDLSHFSLMYIDSIDRQHRDHVFFDNTFTYSLTPSDIS